METHRPLRLEPCKRDAGDRRYTLFLNGARQPSVLVIEAPEVEVELLVQSRHVRLVLLLLDAWHKDHDAGTPGALRGCRNATELGNAALIFKDVGKFLCKYTVVRYFYEIRKHMKQALRELPLGRSGDLAPIHLVEHVPNQGYRIAPIFLEVIPLPRRDTYVD